MFYVEPSLIRVDVVVGFYVEPFRDTVITKDVFM